MFCSEFSEKTGSSVTLQLSKNFIKILSSLCILTKKADENLLAVIHFQCRIF